MARADGGGGRAGSARRRAAVVCVTHGGDGVVAHLRGRDLVVAAPAVTVVDTVGAGDAFCGGLLAHLWRAGVTGGAALDALDDDSGGTR